MICKKCRPAIKKLWPLIKKLMPVAETAVEITQAVKGLLESNAAANLTDVIPGDWDENLRLRAVAVINRVLMSEKGVNKYLTLASAIVAMLDNSKESRTVYDAAAQLMYTVSKNARK